MNKLIDKEIRALLSKEFRSFKKKHPSNKNKLTLIDIEYLYDLVTERQKEANKEIKTKLSNELSMVNLSIFQISLLALIFADRKNKVIPQKYFDKYDVPQINLLVSNFLTIISNHSLSIINLLRNGMDFSSRPIIRTLSELCVLFIVLLALPEKAKIYYSGKNPEEEKQIWYKYFTPSKLKKHLIEVQQQAKIDPDIADLFLLIYDHQHSYYSQTTHTASIISIVGAFSSTETDRLEYSLWGKYSEGMKYRLFDLTIILFFTSEMFRSILSKYYSIEFSNKKYMYALHENINAVIPKLIHKFIKTNA